MCRTGGRRCPGCTSPESRARHNERRRRNRALRRTAIAQASSQGAPAEILERLAHAQPQDVRDWLSNSLDPATRADALTIEGWESVRDADDKTQALLDDLKLAVDEIATSGRVEQWLDAMATDGMHRWSANNRILALTQLAMQAKRTGRPELLDEIHMMTAKQWKDRHGRWPQKGSQAIYLLRPRKRKIVEEDDAGNKTVRVITTGFQAFAAFNITQTDGPPLPPSPVGTPPADGEAPDGAYEALRKKVLNAGYTFDEQEIPGCKPETGDGTLGYTRPSTRQVVIDSRLSPLQKVSTMAHELGHIFAGHVDHDHGEYQQHRGQMETEAEAAAYLTMRRAGVRKDHVDAFAPGYIAAWMAQKGASFQEAMARAVKASEKITAGWLTDDEVEGGDAQ